MEAQKKSSKPRRDLRIELLKAIIQRKDIIVIDDGYSYDEFNFVDEDEQGNLKRKLEESYIANSDSQRTKTSKKNA